MKICGRYFESGWTPVDELDGSFALHGGDGRVDVFGNYVTPVEQTNGHVFTTARITL